MKKFSTLLALSLLAIITFSCSDDDRTPNVYVSFVLDRDKVVFTNGLTRNFGGFIQGQAFDHRDTVYFNFTPDFLEKGTTYPITDGDGVVSIGYVQNGHDVQIVDGTIVIDELTDTHAEITFSGDAESSADEKWHKIKNGIIKVTWKNED